MFDFVVKYFSPLKHVPLLPHVFDSLAGLFSAIRNKNIPAGIDEIEEELSRWEGISFTQHKYGGLQFNYLGKELGHIHGNGLLDIHFPKSVSIELVSNNKALPHHIFKNSGWVSFYLKGKEDVVKALELLKMSYLIRKRRRK